MATPNKILKEALNLKPAQRAELIDKLLCSLDKPDREIDDLESRIGAYDREKIKVITLEKVLEKYK
jgi:hypothetical protein